MSFKIFYVFSFYSIFYRVVIEFYRDGVSLYRATFVDWRAFYEYTVFFNGFFVTTMILNFTY